MIGEYKNLKIYDWQAYLGFSPMLLMSFGSVFFLVFYEFRIIFLVCFFLFTFVPLHYFYMCYNMKVIVAEDKVMWVYGKKKQELYYTDDLRVQLFHSFFSPKIELNKFTNGKEDGGFMLSDYFKDNQEIKKFVDWLKIKKPDLIDDINWDSFFIKYTRF